MNPIKIFFDKFKIYFFVAFILAFIYFYSQNREILANIDYSGGTCHLWYTNESDTPQDNLTEQEVKDLIFASKVCKNTKSNTIVFAKNGTLIASGTGQTSRVDALMQAVDKAKAFGFSLEGASMASDAFFPFPDCVELAKKAGITAVIQPGGSIKDDLSINYCNENNLAMVFTGTRHFKH